MARLFSSGFELNSVTAGVEFDTIGAGTPVTISTTTIRSGTYAGRVTSLTSGTDSGFLQQFVSAAGNGPYYARFYFNVATYPSADNTFFRLMNTAFGTNELELRISSTGTIKLFYRLATVQTQVGSASSALSTGTWYRIEVKFDRSPAGGSQTVELKIDGTVVATASNLTIDGGILAAGWGGNMHGETQTVGDWFFDDLAINDSTGTFQTTYPDSGKIIVLKPNAAGDANTFATQTGGTAGAGNNFTRVNEVTPDDATTFNGSNTLNQEDLFNMDNSGIASSDTVNTVEVNARFANNVADATTAIKLEIEKTTASTISQSAAIVPNTTAWNTNTTVAPRTAPLITYQDPLAANWTQTTLDSMQAGYKITTGGTNAIDVTKLWVTVDYTPATAPTGYASWASALIGQPYFSNDIVSV